ncbi:hypothetical protein DYB25_010900 [Aphanomyces astaci]|uniref:Transmembrane protein n=1 Tax=Aphanomyces astaci TaxID=112090 RepID=A0A397A9X7_APHAT|nr:hypothetical protein DYB25_010900 [Aphanomyces astaci]
MTPSTQTFNVNLDAAGVAAAAQQRPRGEPIYADIAVPMASVRRAAAPASDTSDFQGANLLKDLSQSCDEAWLFLALFVIVMSIQYIAGSALSRLVLRLVTLSVEAFAGLLLQWQPMGYTVTERVVRMFVHLKAIFSPSGKTPFTLYPVVTSVHGRRTVNDACRAVAILPSTTSDAHTDVLSEPFLQRQDEDPKSSAVEAFSGANPVSSTQDVEIEHSEEGLSDLERPTAENTPEVPSAPRRLPDSTIHDACPEIREQKVGNHAISKDGGNHAPYPIDLDMLVNTVERPRFADGYTSIVGNKSVPFHPADVLHWRSGRQAFVLPTVPEERSAARQPPPRLRSREARSSATTDAGFWAGVLNPSCWSLMSPQTSTLPSEV